MRRLMRWMAVLVLLAGGLQQAQAGQACEEKQASVETFVSGMKLAENTLAALEATDAQVARSRDCAIRTWLTYGATIPRDAGWWSMS
jgi:hypothetical protein